METKSYIYRCTNTINGKIYIGQSVNPIKRIKTHMQSSGKRNYLLHYAIKKYGVENFLFEVIRSEVPIEQINEAEIECIKEHNCKVPLGYNLTDGGGGTLNPSEETLAKMKLARVGRKLSEEHKRKIGLASASRKHSEETKVRISLAKTNPTDETREKIRLAAAGNTNMLGKKHSEETRKKLCAARKGRVFTEETKKKMSESAKNMSDETRRRMGDAHRGLKYNKKHKKDTKE